MPSEVFRDHFLTCFIDDPVGFDLRHRIGIENICWELDYPHSDSTWPTPAEHLMAVASAAEHPPTDAELDLLTWGNAQRWYSWNPFARRPRERCTVGALRGEVAGHDVAERSLDTGRREHRDPLTAGAIAERATA
jgi:hypothetical protein